MSKRQDNTWDAPISPAQHSPLSPQSSPPSGQRVLAALSGGVDSAVAAALLVEAGYEVIAVSMLLAGNAEGHEGSCCSIDDFQDARRVSERLDIPYYVLNLKDAFQSRVINVFSHEYVQGRTPNPCLLCNRDLKFDLLWQRARELDAHYVATGHYARIVQDANTQRYQLLRGSDQSKDQSYFLFTLSQEQLARTLFPVGHLTKAEVRDKAHSLGLGLADKPESQDICFVPDGNYARFLEQRLSPERFTPGKVVDRKGQVLGSHTGIHRFTIGQRRGLGLGGQPEPMYVSNIDATTGQVEVGSKADLQASGLHASRVNWINSIDGQQPQEADEIMATVKIRYRYPPIPARILPQPDSKAEVRFQYACPAVTPGQAVVFYDGDRILGGGWIEGAL